MRYLNSAAFGLTVEINSFGHALMLLGYQRLKRWLALLLASSSKGVGARHLLYGAVRRGLLMEELGRTQGDAEMRGEMFICGVFRCWTACCSSRFPNCCRTCRCPNGATGPAR
jgi:EAL and modified HD-GYP domain-containing signal transduction protein